MAEVATGGISKPFDGTVEEAISELEALLHESVRLRMEADVPLGAFLSGGIDSSTVVALMQLQSHRPVRTFTIGSHDLGFNEADKARDLAEFLGTDHTQLYATAKDCAAVIPNLPRLYDEPFADSSQVPTAIVCELAREHVTVCLSGDGGDELFGGYNRHVWTEALLRKTDAISERVRLPVGRLARRISNKSSNPVGRNRLVEGSLDRLHKFGLVLNREGPSELYHSLTSIWPRPTDILLTGSDPEIPRGHLNDWGRANYTHALMYLDAISYLPDDILTKVDRASMGVSLEVRIPLLDHRVVELAWRLPLFMKISTPSGFHMRRGQGKWLLRQVLHRYVPPQLVDHPKMGFSVPIGSWLRDGIREWAEDLLAIGRLKQDGFFNPRIIRGIWDQHLEGDRDLSPYLWPVLMFQAWHDERYPVIQGVAPCS
jgi:asparagine synthase (glutamine-hydrolysing)